ncbi:MAG: FUSC family protein [Methanocellales archaeon]|nr:FUSC family protein [Methanocellales archaeon]
MKAMNHQAKKEKRRIYFLFFILGIVSFCISVPLGLFLEDIIEGLETIYFILLVCLVLFAIGLYISKRRTLGFALKAFTIFFISLILMSGATIAWFAYTATDVLHIERLDFEPEHYFELTEESLDKHPLLREALEEMERQGKDYVLYEVPNGEGHAIFNYLSQSVFKYEGDFYGFALVV